MISSWTMRRIAAEVERRAAERAKRDDPNGDFSDDANVAKFDHLCRIGK